MSARGVRIALALVVSASTVGILAAQESARFDLGWHVVPSGGGGSGGPRFRIAGSVGQPAVAGHLGGQFGLQSGFWYRLAPPPTPPGSPTPSASAPASPTPSRTATAPSAATATATATAPRTGTTVATATATPEGTPVPPRILVVNASDDRTDGACDEVHCSLREAVEAANRAAGPDRIQFDIPPRDPGHDPRGWWTIRPASSYRIEDGDTTIDGTSQTARHGDTNPLGPEIDVNGSGVVDRGLYVVAPGAVIQGLALHGFRGAAIRLEGAVTQRARVRANYVGTDPAGRSDDGLGWGIYICLGAHDNLVGGVDVGAGNLISGNDQAGIGIVGVGTHGNRVAGNRIGTDAAGAGPLPNTYGGVSVALGASANVIGPTNLVAHNAMAGVVIRGSDALGNTVTANRISASEGPGIWLDDGGNGLPASPTISSLSPVSVQGTSCAGCRVEVFSDWVDEGWVYEGVTVADEAGRFRYDHASWLTGPYVTVTGTDPAGATSTFSAPVRLPVWRVALPWVANPVPAP